MRVVNGTVDVGADEFQPPATTTMVSTSGAATFGHPLTFTAVVTPQAAGNPVTGTVTFSIDGTAVGTVPLAANGTAVLEFTPTPATLKPGNHTLTATYNGDTNFTPSAAAQTLAGPTLPQLTTTVTHRRGQFTVHVFDNGQPLQQVVLRSNPIIQMHDINGDGVNDLVINTRRGRKLVVVAAFDGAEATRIA